MEGRTLVGSSSIRRSWFGQCRIELDGGASKFSMWCDWDWGWRLRCRASWRFSSAVQQGPGCATGVMEVARRRFRSVVEVAVSRLVWGWRLRCRTTGVRVKLAVSHDWSNGGRVIVSYMVAVSWCGGGHSWSVVAERRVCES